FRLPANSFAGQRMARDAGVTRGALPWYIDAQCDGGNKGQCTALRPLNGALPWRCNCPYQRFRLRSMVWGDVIPLD
ncbi:MAG TPA: hypothetical protein VGK81_04820, partial [Anaerolineae bacterium]